MRMRTLANMRMLALIIEVYVQIPSSLSYPLVLHYSSRVKTDAITKITYHDGQKFELCSSFFIFILAQKID